MGAAGASIRLTLEPAEDTMADWFPDGRRVAFLSDRSGRRALWVADTVSGGADPLAELDASADWYRLSPHGELVAYHAAPEGGPLDVWTMELATGAIRRLTRDPELAGYPVWSPDGARIAFEIKRGGDTHVVVMARDGRDVVQLTADPGLAFPGSFSPDGGRVAFAAMRDGVWDVFWVTVVGREQRRLTDFADPAGFVRYPTWSPAGDRIVFERAESSGDLWLLDLT
jgi:TolB protein